MSQNTQEKSIFERYAIFQTGGKQYQALENKTIAIEKIDAQEGEIVEFPDVLLRKLSDENVEVGKPFVSTPVKATVLKHTKGPKLIVFKFKRRKKHMRKKGHRQPCTVIRIQEI
jgi:large subunit ribosomal protein L21